jgi:hypothetical protein
VLLDPLEQFEHRHPQGVGNHFYGVQGGISLAAFKTAQVRLIEATPLTKHRLAHASGLTQAAYTRAKLD